MYRILIVDDERYAIDGIVKSQDWQDLGIDVPFTAHNIRQAKEVLLQQSIDILFCDIEMPNGSGIELMRWMKERDIDVISIIFTCHSDFRYAKQAVSLQVMEYLVKPVYSEEVREVLVRAVSMLEERQQRRKAARRQADERYWRMLLEGHLPLAEDDPAGEEPCRIVQFVVQKGSIDELEARVRALFPDGRIAALFPHGEHTFTLVVHCPDHTEREDVALVERLERFASSWGQPGGVTCYVGEPSTRRMGRASYLKLLRARNNTIVGRPSGVVLTRDVAHLESGTPLTGEMRDWLELFAACQEDALKDAISVSLQQLRQENHMGLAYLEKWIQDYMQVVYVALNQIGLQAHTIFQDEAGLHFLKTVRSLEELEQNAHSMAVRTVSMIREGRQNEGLCGRVKAYINEHSTGELSRRQIAAHFYMNPDYLSRIFKGRYGISILDYITQRRVEQSKGLLAHSESSISEIAGMVGYSNYSHFSKVFKEATGMKPVEYRKRFRDGR